jgi:hypothetical protein
MNNDGSSSNRPSLSVPGTSGIVDDERPTIGRLLAETNINQTVASSSSYLTVDSNIMPGTNQQQQHRERS